MIDFDTAYALPLGTEIIAFGDYPFQGTITAMTDDGPVRTIQIDWHTTFMFNDGTGEVELDAYRYHVFTEGDGYRFRLADNLIGNAADDKWNEVKAKRDAVEYGGTNTPLGFVQTDLASQSRIIQTYTFSTTSGENWQVGWTMSDNTTVKHTKQEFAELTKVVGQHISDTHSRAQALREFVYSRASVEEIEAIVVSELWDNAALTDQNNDFILDHLGLQILA